MRRGGIIQQLVSQVVLPIVLAAIMLVMGLGLTRQHFIDVFRKPLAALLGLGLQMLFLPALALVIIFATGLTGVPAAGLFLLSLCPGGATSNLFSALARGNVALSICLTSISSLLIPFSLPLAFAAFLSFAGEAVPEMQFPIDVMIKQLIVVTLVPVLVGMALRHFAENWVKSIEVIARRVATFAMMAVIILLMATNLPLVMKMVSAHGLIVLMLSIIALTAAWTIAHQLKCSESDSRTLALETGVQNAGTAMMVALSIMHQPALAMIPLMYGLLMNIPAFGFIGWLMRRDQRQGSVQH